MNLLLHGRQQKLSKPMVLWWLVAAFVLPSAFFAETIILLSQTYRVSLNWLMPLWWVLYCGVVVVFFGLITTWLNETLGKLVLASYVVFSFIFLKLVYVEGFATLSDGGHVLTAASFLLLGWLIVIKTPLTRKTPPLIFFILVASVFVGTPLLAASDLKIVRELKIMLREPIFSVCFSGYVDDHSDLQNAYKSRTSKQKKASWGENHYRKYGQFEQRHLPGICRDAWVLNEVANSTPTNANALSAPISQCFSEYVDSHADLMEKFSSEEDPLNKAAWGQNHFRTFGHTESRSLPAGCRIAWQQQVASELISQMSAISFRERPNFYILLFDSMIPEPVAAQFFGDGNTGYVNLINKEFYVPVGVTLQNAAPTTPSIMQINWLDLTTPEESELLWGGLDGDENSPLTELFQSNDYQITRGIAGERSKETAGPYLDLSLNVEPLLGESLLCMSRVDNLMDRLSAFGACSFLGEYSSMPPLLELLKFSPPDPYVDADTRRRKNWPNRILEHLETVGEKSRPQLTFLYNSVTISHASSNFKITRDLGEYQTKYREMSEDLSNYLREIISILREKDPGSILLVAGDHGPKMSIRHEEIDPGFRLVDYYSVAIGLWKSENRCARQVAEVGFTPNKNGYHTIPSAILSIVQCLADDQALMERLAIRAEFSREEVGGSWEEFLRKNLSPSMRELFKNSR